MPFAVFRRHQRKLLAIFAILAMFGFVVADSLPRLLNGSPVGGGNAVVVDLYGKPVRQSDLAVIRNERNDANFFMAELTSLLYRGQGVRDLFGDLTTKSLVDAMILEHEADKLGMPGGPDVARDFLKKNVGANMTKELFELVLSRFQNKISGEQLLTEIGNQIRLANVRRLIGPPVVTPLDVFTTYRDQNERVSAKAVGYRVEDFLAKVKEPSTSEVQAFYGKYKDVLPDPARPTPGFKVPRQVQVEILSVDGAALATSIKDKLTEAELRTYYENRKNEFKVPSAFPDDIFVGEPPLPPLVESFSDKRPYLAVSLADEKAQAEIIDRFERIKDAAMVPFVEKYLTYVDETSEARKAGEKTIAAAPRPEPLKALAAKESLEYDLTPLMDHEVAEKYGLISGSEVGSSKLSGGRKFAEEIFESRGTLYEPIELTDFSGRRYLIRKLQDVAPRVPPLDEIRPQVVLAWKTAQARPDAEKAARAYAEKVKANGGKIDAEIVDGRPVVTTDPVPKLQAGFRFPAQNIDIPASVSEISQIPNPGEALRSAYFNLREGDVVVEPNQPETVYYVLTLKQRIAAPFSILYAPNGDYPRYQSETLRDAARKRDEQWMNVLRAEAGLKPGWTPPADAKTAASDEEA